MVELEKREKNQKHERKRSLEGRLEQIERRRK
jgi:hypothetical protein